MRMEICYKRESGENYLVIRGAKPGDDYMLKMLSENDIPGILQLRIRRTDDCYEYRYRLGGGIALSKCFQNCAIGTEDIRSIITGLSSALAAMAEYLVDADMMIPNPEMIYYDRRTGQVELCCYPAHEMEMEEGLRELTALFIRKTDHRDEAGTELAYALFAAAEQPGCSIRSLMEVLGEARQEKRMEVCADPFSGITKPPKPADPSDSAESTEPFRVCPEDLRHPGHKVDLYGWAATFAGLTVDLILYFSGLLSEIGIGTRILVFLLIIAFFFLGGRSLEGRRRKEGAEEAGFLQKEQAAGNRTAAGRFDVAGNRSAAGGFDVAGNRTAAGDFAPRREIEMLLVSSNSFQYDSLEVDAFPFYIGNDPGLEKGWLSYGLISPLHARIERTEAGVMIADCGSENGTYVNGVRLLPDMPKRVCQGDEIRLADRPYVLDISGKEV